MRVVIHKNGMLEMTIINVIFLTNVEKCVIFGLSQLLPGVLNIFGKVGRIAFDDQLHFICFSAAKCFFLS